MPPDIFFAVIAEAVEVHGAVARRPEARTDSAQGIWNYRAMFARHDLTLARDQFYLIGPVGRSRLSNTACLNLNYAEPVESSVSRTHG
jgi:hypothetical protein